MATATQQPPILDAEIVNETTALVTRNTGLEVLQPIMDIEVARQRLEQFQKFVQFYLVENEDFGKIPGVKKASLWKSGADKLCEIYGLEETYTELRITENWSDGLFDYTIHCALSRNGLVRGVGVGSCSSFESKYRWRESARVCPNCGKGPIIKGKDEFGGGWVCWGKKGGCGTKFKDGDQNIEGQSTERVLNPDMADVKNTILKMAKKRAKVDATLAATRSSGIFTQDVEDVGVTNAGPAQHEESAPAWNDIGAAETKPAQPANGGSYISDRDRQALYALIGKNGKTHEQFVTYLRTNYAATPSTIPTLAFADLCLWAKGGQ